MKEEETRKVVREGYARIARGEGSCCAPSSSCCGQANLAEDISQRIGYRSEEIDSAPDGANLGLGCGNPTAIASLKEGETVLDLGAGAGFDCFLAANKVGERGRVIGVDMTPEMVDRARVNAKKGNYKNIEFRLGEIENIPVADNTVDVVISNCVINLSLDKKRVFQEAFRVLKPGGRLMVSDIILLKELPDSIRNSDTAYVGCIAGAIKKDGYLELIREAGFREVEVASETNYPVECTSSCCGTEVSINKSGEVKEGAEYITDSVASVMVKGTKP